MSLRHSTYLSFTGNATEVLTYYQSVFGGDLTIEKYGDMENLDDFPFDPDPEWVAHGELRGTVNVSGGDGGDQPLKSNAYSMLIYADDPDEGASILKRLEDDGGSVAMPYEQAPWGDYYGQVHDKFGVLWAVSSAHK